MSEKMRALKKYLKKNCVIKSSAKPRLKYRDPDGPRAHGVDKDSEKGILDQLHGKLSVLQELLYAQQQHKVLVVLQAMDTAGKDGVIKHVFRGVNPQGVRVASFKAPTHEELGHDYLWRVHAQAPKSGEIVIFNRSHYEDVLITRVHGLVPPVVWKKRFRHINEFERMLSDEGTLILKFFLHISKAEQKKRLESRLDDPDKHWKFSVDDLKERKLWPDYMKAYEDAIRETSTPWAPWLIIPSNRKWYRNLLVMTAIVEALQGLKLRYPKPKNLSHIRVQ